MIIKKKKYYPHLYFVTFDNVINCIKYRFNQTDYQIYVHHQDVSERSFSSLKRIKTHLRLATTNNRLIHLLILHIHELLIERLDLTKVADEFVERREGGKSKFGL